MLSETPKKTITTMTAVLLACQPQGRIRAYAGRSVGMRRDLSVCRYIARDIAPRLLWPLEFRDGDRVAGEADLIPVFERVLESIPDEQAFLLVSREDRQRREIRSMIGKRLAKRLLAAFTVSQVDRTDDVVRRSISENKQG